MILLQDAEQTVSFDPLYINSTPPWYEKIFALYLAFMLLVLVARGAQLCWHLARLRRLQKAEATTRFNALCRTAHVHADSLRRFSVLTFVFVLADFCLAAANILANVAEMKSPVYRWISRDASDLLYLSAFGLLVCAALYAAGFFFQSRIACRQLSFEKKSLEAQARAPQQNN